jgi:uncharacterized membrane protein
VGGLAIARALHVLGVVLWIGGVAFVTTVLLPTVRRLEDPARRVAVFEEVESRFARQARATTLLVGASGFWMMVELDAWPRLLVPAYWWIHGMIAVWLLFTLLLFLLEPLFLHRWFLARARQEPERTFARIERMHRVLLVVSLATLLGAVAGAHGLLLFAG